MRNFAEGRIASRKSTRRTVPCVFGTIESLRVAKRKIIAISATQSRKYLKATVNISDSIEEHYLDITLQADKIISRWSHRDVADLLQHDASRTRNWDMCLGVVTERGIELSWRQKRNGRTM